MEYRVIDGSTEVAEFKIVVTENGKYYTKYELIPILNLKNNFVKFTFFILLI